MISVYIFWVCVRIEGVRQDAAWCVGLVPGWSAADAAPPGAASWSRLLLRDEGPEDRETSLYSPGAKDGSLGMCVCVCEYLGEYRGYGCIKRQLTVGQALDEPVVGAWVQDGPWLAADGGALTLRLHWPTAVLSPGCKNANTELHTFVIGYKKYKTWTAPQKNVFDDV